MKVVQKLKEEGKIKHFEISFHDNADVLDMILTENPDIEVDTTGKSIEETVEYIFSRLKKYL